MTPAVPPHALSADQVVSDLVTDPRQGLSAQEAALRLVRFGPNTMPVATGPGLIVSFLKQFHDPLVYVLLASAVVTISLGQLVDTTVILGVVLLNAVIGQVQQSRAEHALDALAALCSSDARVTRDGAVSSVPSGELVPGDVVVLAAGDQVPADCRLVVADTVEVDESSLTGESAPVAKDTVALPAATVLADRRNMAYSGTLVIRGSGRGVVAATGRDTELGRITHLVGTTAAPTTPLTRKLAKFSRQLAVVIVALAAVTFVTGILRGYPAGEMFTAAVAMAVGAIPEGLPAAVTIVLAIGVVRMARRNAIVRRLPAVETLGGTTVICTDKTGTLTENRMTVRTVLAGGRAYDDALDVDGNIALRECLTAAALCNDAADPTEHAMISAATAAGLDVDGLRTANPRLDTLPFESTRLLMATIHSGLNGLLTGYVKGAPERVLALCDDQVGVDGAVGPLDAERQRAVAESYAGRGLRVLATARFTPPRDGAFDGDHSPEGLTLLGFQAMQDPPRREALDAVDACRQAGIDIKMITGDHAATANAIAREFGLTDGSVFARVSPEQKLRLVKRLQDSGHVVAMTGDGVNDAPALRRADIGIAMGRAGTEVAKQAADMVLADDNFASVEAAVEEGRAVFDNLRKFLAWTLPTNIAEGLVIVVAVALGTTLPILPVQVLWINMTTAVFLGLTLAFEPMEPGVMTRPPRSPRQPLMNSDLVRRIVFVSIVLVSGAFAVFEWELRAGSPVQGARTAAITVFVVAQIAYLFSCRSLEHLRANGRNRWLLGGIGLMTALQLLIIYLPAANELFHTAPLGVRSWGVVLGVGVAVYLVSQADKLIWRPRVSGRPSPPPPLAHSRALRGARE